MKILQFKADNFMRLETVEINPKDNTVMITGPNGAGKSSVLRGLVALFCGKNSWPEMPIKEGENTAVLEAKTEDFTAKLTIRRQGKHTLEVRAIDGKARYTAPQDFFNDIRDRFSFDPLQFSQEDPKKQRQILMNLVGLDFSDIRGKYIECQQERATLNSNKSLLQQKVDAIEVPADTPNEEVSISSLATKLQEANTFNTNLEQILNTIITIEKDMVRYNEEISTRLATIETQKKLLKVAQDKQNELLAMHAERGEAIEGINKKDTTTIQTEIEAAEATNRDVHLKQNREELRKAIDAKSNEYVELGQTMKDLELEKAARLSKVEMPVEGLSVSGDSVLFEGIPLSQVNTSKALEICIAISMALSPKLKVLWGKANDLDDNSLEIIKRIAAENDYQIWLEKVDTTGQIGFYLEEGKVKTKE